jgi:peroxiredoxin
MQYTTLPADLPVPHDDGAADHLTGLKLPEITLQNTNWDSVNLATLPSRFVLYVYPMTGQPGVALPEGWDQIPGARGCTPQACGFRDHFQQLQALNTHVFGLSSQNTVYQSEVHSRLHLPFPLLSDPTLLLKETLQLPTFTIKTASWEAELYKRITLIVKDGLIIKVFYPVFPPDENAAQVITWLTENSH